MTAVIGVDVGGTKILGVRLEPGTGAVPSAEVKVATPPATGDLLGVLGEVLDGLLEAGEEPGAVGLGVPALVGVDGMVCFSPHLPGLVGTGLAGALGTLAPTAATWVGNDASAAGWAEHRVGAGSGVGEMIMVTLGTGIGGGIVTGGRLREGANRFAGEWGHMVLDPHGPPCPCGRRGCWERYASGSGLGRLGRETAQAGRATRVVELAGGDPEAVRGEHVSAAACEGDPEALRIMADLGWWLALGLANLANILDPAIIVVGGGLVAAGEVLLGPVRAAFGDLVEAAPRRQVRIEAAHLGPAAGAVGAALLARDFGDQGPA